LSEEAEYLKTGEAAERFHLSQDSLKRWIREGKLKAGKTPGGHNIISVAELKRFLELDQGDDSAVEKGGAGAGGAKLHILLVEDNVEIRNVIVFSLEKAGYQVTTAGSGPEALAKSRDGHFDLYLIDKWLPEGSDAGIEVCRNIREHDTHTPIIICSAIQGEAEVKKAREAGAQDYLKKPDDILTIDERVAQWLTKR
jgi:excisionase family DNA binding protein